MQTIALLLAIFAFAVFLVDYIKTKDRKSLGWQILIVAWVVQTAWASTWVTTLR